MKKDNQLYLRHVLEAIESIEEYLETATYEDFEHNHMLYDAVVRQLSIVGEAANRLSVEFQKNNPSIPFTEIISMRNHLVHEYMGISKKTVWKTCHTDLPELQQCVKAALETGNS